LRGGNFCLDSRQVLGALTFLLGALRLEASGLRSRSFVRGGGFRRGVRRGSLFLGGSLHVRCLATAACRRFGGDDGSSDRLGNGVRATSAGCRSGRCRSFRTHALFAFPARANASHLVVAEHAHMATNRDVHLPKQTDDLIGRNPEFVRQLADCELAQTSSPILLARGGLGATSSRTPAANCRSVIPTTAV